MDELPVRSNAAVSGDTVTLTMSEPITQGQTVTVSYDNLFTNSEPIFSDAPWQPPAPPSTEQTAANYSTVTDVNRPGGGLALSRTDLIVKEGSERYLHGGTDVPAHQLTSPSPLTITLQGGQQ